MADGHDTPATPAMRLVMAPGTVAADRDGWLAARRAGVGASEIGSVMRLDGAWSSPYALWAEKTGLAVPPDQVPHRLRFGLYVENYVAWRVAEEHPELHVIDGGLYASAARPWQLATFDRLAHYADAECGGCSPGAPAGPPAGAVPLQIKSAVWSDWSKHGIPLSVRAQCLWEMDVAGADGAALAVLDPSRVDRDIPLFTLHRDDDAETDLTLMRAAALEFLDCVRDGTEPAVDALPPTTEALRRRYADIDPDAQVRLPARLAAGWRRARLAEKTAEDRRRGYENQLRARAGTAGQWCVLDPDTGELATFATRSARPRAGYEVKPKDRVETLRPAARIDGLLAGRSRLCQVRSPPPRRSAGRCSGAPTGPPRSSRSGKPKPGSRTCCRRTSTPARSSP